VRRGAYPGSFDPPTVAHLAIAQAARAQLGLDRVDWIVSRVALGKGPAGVPSLEDRVAVLRAVAAERPWLDVKITAAQLLVDVAAGYDVVVLGADKWAQVLDPAWYGSLERRDAAVAALPSVLVAPRPPHPLPVADPPRLEVLSLEEAYTSVSSSAVRRGRRDWMLPEAAVFDEQTGAWSQPYRYLATRRVSDDDDN
jgi:hypothetical protein